MVRQLDEEAAASRAVAASEQGRVTHRDSPCPSPIADTQPARHLPFAAAGQSDQALAVLGQECLAEPGHALGSGQVGPRDEPAEASPANLRASQQDEVRTAGPLTDPSQILLDGVAMTGEPGLRWTWPGRHALPDQVRPRAGSGLPIARAPAPWPARPNHHLCGVRDRRVQQLDLEADHGMDPGSLGGAHEANRAIEPGVVRDGHPRKPDLDSPIDQFVRRGRTIEEREVGVAMELGVADLGHESPGLTG